MPFSLHRRAVLAGGLALGALAGAARAQGLSTIPAAPFAEARTTAGRVRGGTARGALCFKGIPYAGRVGGQNRFKAPPPVEPWSGVRDALTLGAPTLQREKQTYGEQEPAYSEDCLFLNVWTPAIDSKARPVLVYLHGGGYSTGSAGSPTQDGGRMAQRYDLVVVAPNHRLGLLGFLRLPGDAYAASGNQGMFDMIAALQWVRDNIANFGGDPGNVTIFGESGGGGKVGTLMGMPAAKGLFHKAGISSGAQLNRMPLIAAEETTKRLMKALAIADPAKLADVPAQTLLDLQWAGEKGQGGLSLATDGYAAPKIAGLPGISFSESTVAGHFGPVVDGVGIPDDPFSPAATHLCAGMPLLIGNNRTEASFFFLGQPEVYSLDDAGLTARITADFGDQAPGIVATYRGLYPQASPSELFLLIATARTMGFETGVLADRKAAQPAPVYRYRWDYPSNRPIGGVEASLGATLGAGHATDIGPMFDNWDEKGLHGDGPGVQAASEALSAAWASFARSGRPVIPGAPAWPRYDAATRPVMMIDAASQVVNDPDAAARQMWEKLAG